MSAVWDITAVQVSPKAIADGVANLTWTTNLGDRYDLDAYILQRCESSDNVNWGEWNWNETSGSVTTYQESKIIKRGDNFYGFSWLPTLLLAVEAPPELGHFYKFRVRSQYTFKPITYGEETLYSEWVESNSLRRRVATLEPWTDDPLVAGDTYIKAIHMTELQECANALRLGYGADEIAFTPAIAEITSLALWKQQVEEIRAALDEINSESVSWLDIPVNCPRADVMMQLRAVIDSL